MAKEKKQRPFRWFWEGGHNPWEELETMHKRLMEEAWKPLRGFAREIAGIPVNISETEKEIIVRAELPGFKKEEVSLNVTADSVEIRAEKKREEMAKTETFYRKESERRVAQRAFSLPVRVDPDSADARLSEGILELRLKKVKEEEKKKKSVAIR